MRVQDDLQMRIPHTNPHLSRRWCESRTTLSTEIRVAHKTVCTVADPDLQIRGGGGGAGEGLSPKNEKTP